MKKSILMSSALGAAALLFAGVSAPVGAAEPASMMDFCNPVWTGFHGFGKIPAIDARKNVVRHNGSYACPTAKPAAATPATEFLVFFDWDKSNITPEAKEIIRNAAAAAKAMGASRVDVVGHTDTSGSPRYNQRLSEKRAANAKSELVKNGLGAGAVTTAGRGETELLVQTRDGVREPSNRRAQIGLIK